MSDAHRTVQEPASILRLPESYVNNSSRFPAVLLFGMPGVGKGTQGSLLGSMQKFFHVSTGEIFRGLDPESADGKLVAEYIDHGELCPDQLTVDIWRNWVEREIENGHFQPESDVLILDGIPRSVFQCEMLANHIDVLAVIHLEPDSDEAVVERLRKRAETDGRADDDESIIRKRLQIYRDTTHPVVHHYADEIVHTIDPIGTVPEINKRIIELVVPAIRRFRHAS